MLTPREHRIRTLELLLGQPTLAGRLAREMIDRLSVMTDEEYDREQELLEELDWHRRHT